MALKGCCNSTSIRSCGHQMRSSVGRSSGIDLVYTDLKNNVDVIIARSCDFAKAQYSSSKKSYIDQILAAGLATDTS